MNRTYPPRAKAKAANVFVGAVSLGFLAISFSALYMILTVYLR